MPYCHSANAYFMTPSILHYIMRIILVVLCYSSVWIMGSKGSEVPFWVFSVMVSPAHLLPTNSLPSATPPPPPPRVFCLGCELHECYPTVCVMLTVEYVLANNGTSMTVHAPALDTVTRGMLASCGGSAWRVYTHMYSSREQ